MSDLIDRQAAIDYFVTNVGWRDEDGYPVEDSDELRKIWTDLFNGVPSAQPERKKGHWIEIEDEIITGKCSVCGWDAIFAETDVVGMPYCPNCGADMRGEEG